MSFKISIICSLLPPFKDAVGESALKLKELLCERGYLCSIITSENQTKRDEVNNVIKNWNFIGVISLIKYVRKERISLVIFQYPTPLYKRNISITFIAFLLKFIRVRVITYLHEYENYSLVGKLRILPLLLFSNSLVTSDRNNYNLLKNKIFVITDLYLVSAGSNFRDELFRKAMSLEKIHPVGKKILNVLCFGLIMEGKGFENILLMANESIDNNIQFNVIGSLPQNPSHAAIDVLKSIQTHSHIKYYGFLEEKDLLNLFDFMDIIYLPFDKGVTERRTSFMTCMGFGKIIITTRPLVPIDGLVEGENIFFIDDLSKDSFYSLINKIKAIEESKIKRIKSNAHKWYMENYSDKIFLNKFIKILNK